ncbi:hypothetical protein KKA85_08545 [bacterium]|nr:hypothetical protein [bacterium]MBU1675813.1 hypothetical protein [bacterium]
MKPSGSQAISLTFPTPAANQRPSSRVAPSGKRRPDMSCATPSRANAAGSTATMCAEAKTPAGTDTSAKAATS